MKPILITTKDFNTKITTNYKDISNIASFDSIECLIFHSSEGTDNQILNCLMGLKEKIKKIIYVVPSTDEKAFLYKCIFSCLEADIYESEDYLEDDEIISYIIDNYKCTGMTISESNKDINLLKKSMVLSDEEKNDLLLDNMKESLSRIENLVYQYENIDKSILDIINKAAENEKKSKEELQKLNDYINKLENSPKPNTPFIYSTYKVPMLHSGKILYVKNYGCNYIISFLCAYQQYLKIHKNHTSKILLFLPKLNVYSKRYSHIPSLSADTINLMKLSKHIYTVFDPRKAILEKFFQEEVDVHIVIDCMFGEKIIEGNTVEEYSAISGSSDIEKFNLDISRTIVAIKKTANIEIPFIMKYFKFDEYERRNAYFQHCSKGFTKLDEVLLNELQC
ncbi:hypothetical protein QEW_4636 [Clostridioides difficile CD160]|nr:hypothetical protein QEW_4636 [Clostridioides difficile CD160]